jgi:hypothetical protein
MKKISSTSTWFYKTLFPLVWFGFLAAMLGITVTSGDVRSQGWIPVLILGFMAVFGFFIMKKLIWDLADEVHDCGDYLLIKHRGEEERVPLSNVMNVNMLSNVKPARITLRLVNPGKFGTEISFAPPSKLSFDPFAKNEIAEDLIIRVDRARAQRA